LDDKAYPSIDFGDVQAFDLSHARLLKMDLNDRSVVALLLGGRKARQCICPFVVLLGYMLDSDFIEFGNEVADRLVISLEEGLPYLEFASDLADYQLGVAITCDLSRPKVMG